MGRAKLTKKEPIEGDSTAADAEAANDNANSNKLTLGRARSKWLTESCYTNNTHAPPHRDALANILTNRFDPQPSESLRSYVSKVTQSDRTVYSIQLSNAAIDSVPPFTAYCAPLVDITQPLVDLHLNAGGPVWTSAFGPKCEDQLASTSVDIDLISLDQYLSVGVSQIGLSRSDDVCAEPQQLLGIPGKTDSLLQIWRIHGTYTPTRRVDVSRIPQPAKKKSDDPNYVPKPKGRPRKYPKPEEPAKEADAAQPPTPTPTAATPSPVPLPIPLEERAPAVEVPRFCNVQADLAYCVSLQGRGSTWSAVWGPAMPLDGSNMLGLLALELGDGASLVLQLPTQVTMPNTGASRGIANRSANSSGAHNSLDAVPVLTEGSTAGWEISIPGLLVQCVAWNPHRPGQLSCGMSDGSVTIWDLVKYPITGTTAGVIKLTTPTLHLVDTQHLEPQITSLSAARRIQHCPFDANLLVVGTQEDIKVWNVKQICAPVFVKKVPTAITSLAWDPHGYGFYSGDGETTAIMWTPLWGASFKPMHRKELYSHSHYYGGAWGLDASSNDAQTLLLSAGSDGTVRGGYASLMTYAKSKNTATMEIFHTHSIERVGDVLYFVADGKASVLPSGMGTESFAGDTLMAMQSIDSVEFNVTGSDVAMTSITAGTSAPTSSTPTPKTSKASKDTSSKKRPRVIDSDSDDVLEAGGESYGDSDADSDIEFIGINKGTAKDTGKGKRKAKGGKTKDKEGAESNTVDAGAAPSSLAPMRLVVYGGAAGLVRIHSVDPLRTLQGVGLGK